MLSGLSVAIPVGFVSTVGWLSAKPPNWILGLAFGFCFLATSLWKLAISLRRIANLRTALDAEIETGNQLNRLMKHGYDVFHDLPANGSNIDHLVIGPNGVFAVETKGRRKPTPNGKWNTRWCIGTAHCTGPTGSTLIQSNKHAVRRSGPANG